MCGPCSEEEDEAFESFDAGPDHGGVDDCMGAVWSDADPGL